MRIPKDLEHTSADGASSEQDKVHPGQQDKEDCGRIGRRSAAHDGTAFDAPRENGECSLGRRGIRGLVSDTPLTRLSERPNLSRNTIQENEQDLMKVIRRKMDLVFPPVDLARPQGLPGAQTALLRMQSRAPTATRKDKTI